MHLGNFLSFKTFYSESITMSDAISIPSSEQPPVRLMKKCHQRFS